MMDASPESNGGGLIPSANGFTLECTTSMGNTFTFVAHWRAPFFVYVELGDDAQGKELEPLFYHAETWEDAERFASHGGGPVIFFDAHFAQVDVASCARNSRHTEETRHE